MFAQAMQFTLRGEMKTAEYVVDPLADLNRFVCLMAGAQGAPDVVAAVRDYLTAWPAQRVARMQRVDAGWAPFDDKQKPTLVYRAADVQKICDDVHRQCVALTGAGMALAPELLELDVFLFLACAKLATLESELAPIRAPQPSARAAASSGTSVHSGSRQLAKNRQGNGLKPC